MADLIVIEELRSYLVAQGIAVDNGSATIASPSTAVPTIWLEPRDGAPEPRNEGGTQIENVTITLSETISTPARDMAAWITETFVEVIVKARQNRDAILTQRKIADLIQPGQAYGGRFMWTMGSLLVESSRVWLGDQAFGQNKTCFTRVQSLQIDARRKALAGLPTLP